jgi:hypothetical protein
VKLIQQLILLAGLAQIGLVSGSLAIPKILNWRGELAKVNLLIKQMFWVYAAYIVVINLCFGLISVFAYRDLTDGSKLAVLINGFIAVYWISRVFVQFLYFDRASFPTGIWPKIGETVLIMLFIFLSVVYSYTCYLNW